MAWQRIDDKQLAWDLMRSGLLYIKSSMTDDMYSLYDADCRTAWEEAPEHKDEWFSPKNDRENYIQIEE